MIFVDANILLYAEDAQNPLSTKVCEWWDAQLSGSSPVCLSWQVINAFIRISTNYRVYKNPLTLNQALSRVQSWLDQPCVRVIVPTGNHWGIVKELLIISQAKGNLVSYAHLAALAIEYGCTLFSTDTDFSRFPKLIWKNPLT